MFNMLRKLRASAHENGFCQTLTIYAHVTRWAFAKKVKRAEFVCRRIHDYKMYLSLREPGISESLNAFGSREPEHRYIIDRVLKKGMCVLDIGGNIGYYALMAAQKVGSQGKVYAVEPEPANCRILRKNVTLNRFDSVMEVTLGAISDSDGERSLHLSHLSNLHSFHDAVDPELTGILELKGEILAVKTWDLVTFIRDRRKPDFIRMDVEGHEVEILTGLVRAAEKEQWYPTVLFEVHTEQYHPVSHDICKPLSDLFALGYQPRFIASNAEPADGFHRRCYEPFAKVIQRDKRRGIYKNVSQKHLLEIIQERDQVRCMLLERHGGAGEN